jgi:ABC-type transport system, involved in lipoprotein release, permease component
MNLYKLAFNNIRRKKLRSALTALGIIIGAATIVVLLGITAGATSAVQEQTDQYMYDVVIAPASSSGTYLMDSQTVSKVENLSNLYGLREVTIFSENINGTRVNFEGVNDWRQVKLINGTQGVVINKATADKFGLGIGDKIKAKDQQLTITGISKEEQAIYVYLNQDTAQKVTGNKVSAIYAKSHISPNATADEIEKQVNDVSVLTKSEKVAEIQKQTSQALLFIGIIACIALVVGIISVVNTMMMSVMERTRELGVLKAIGFTNWELKGSILFESGLLGFLGAILGVILGIIGIVVFANMLDFTDYIPQMMPLWLIGGVIVGSTILCILAGLYPAMRASKLNVVEALRHE